MKLLAGYEDRVLAWTDGAVRTEFEGSVQCIDGGPAGVFVGTTDGVYRRSDDADHGDNDPIGDNDSTGDGGPWEHVADLGDVTAIAVADSGVWAGTEPSAVYHAPDGREFAACTDLDSLPSSDSWAFPPRPSTHHVRWLEPTNERLYAAVEAGALLRSSDGGETWQDRVPSGPYDTHSMATHPDRPDLAYSAAGDGFYVTEDGGDDWRTEEEGLDRTYCWSVVCDPTDPGRLLLSSAHGARTAHNYGQADTAVYRRTDGEWERCSGLPGPEGLLRAELATTGEAGVALAATNHGLYRTGDWGESWSALGGDWPTTLESKRPRGLVVV